LRVVGGALKEVIHTYALFSPNIQVPGVETYQKGRPYKFMETLGGSYDFCEREKMAEHCLCSGFFKTYALIPCLFFNRKGLSMNFIPFLAFNLNHKQFGCNNQDHKKKHHAQEHKKYPGKPFSTREENPANPLLYSSRERPPPPRKNSTQKGAYKP
jgi:hypothetical protein